MTRPLATRPSGLLIPQVGDRVLTVRQPWADLIMAGAKPVENRTWPVPSTLPRHSACETCDVRFYTHGAGSHRRCPGLPGRPGAWSESRDLGPFPFRIWVHAGKTEAVVGDWVNEAWMTAWRAGLFTAALDDSRHGVILGSVEVTGCHHADECYPTGHYAGGCTCAGPHIGVGVTHEPGCGLEPWCSPWADADAYHWQLADPQPLDTPIPATGRLGLWTITDEAAA